MLNQQPATVHASDLISAPQNSSVLIKKQRHNNFIINSKSKNLDDGIFTVALPAIPGADLAHPDADIFTNPANAQLQKQLIKHYLLRQLIRQARAVPCAEIISDAHNIFYTDLKSDAATPDFSDLNSARKQIPFYSDLIPDQISIRSYSGLKSAPEQLSVYSGLISVIKKRIPHCSVLTPVKNMHHLWSGIKSVIKVFIGTGNKTVKAAVFTKAEIKSVKKMQRAYAEIKSEKMQVHTYSDNKSVKKQAQALIQNQNSRYVLRAGNYYRKMWGLPVLALDQNQNKEAGVGALALAATSANPNVNQHGMSYVAKPARWLESDFNSAKKVTALANLDFSQKSQGAAGIVGDFISDDNDLSGYDTGHRAWMLSPKIKTTGFATCYSKKNKVQYSVMPILNKADAKNKSTIKQVFYPAPGLFPIEAANSIWSIYLTNKTINTPPKIEIIDLDTKKITQGVHCQNFNNNQYGFFKTILTYKKGKTKLIPGHEYQIKIKGIAQYKFKLFNEKTKRVLN